MRVPQLANHVRRVEEAFFLPTAQNPHLADNACRCSAAFVHNFRIFQQIFHSLHLLILQLSIQAFQLICLLIGINGTEHTMISDHMLLIGGIPRCYLLATVS